MTNDDYSGLKQEIKRKETPVGPVYIGRTGNGKSKKVTPTPEPFQPEIETEWAKFDYGPEAKSIDTLTEIIRSAKDWSGKSLVGVGVAAIVFGAGKGSMDAHGMEIQNHYLTSSLILGGGLSGGVYSSSNSLLNRGWVTVGSLGKGVASGAAAATLLFLTGYAIGYVANKAFN